MPLTWVQILPFRPSVDRGDRCHVFFFLRNVALFFNIVYLVGTLPPAPLSEVCVCPCNRL